MEVQDFIRKWRGARLKERSAAQEHFNDLCRVFKHPTPAEADPNGEWYCFEAGVDKAGGGHGYADVWKQGFFAWEYKGPKKDLDEAYLQLLRYHDHLGQPPLLVVTDMQQIVIHTKFTNTVPKTYAFTIEDLSQPTFFNYLHKVFHDPDGLRPDLHPDHLTQDAAATFARLADGLREEGHAPRPVAHFLTQTVFCFFAEDIGLLPRGGSGRGLFTEIVKTCQRGQARLFPQYANDLFRAMSSGGHVQLREVAHFNGGLFEPGQEQTIPPLGAEEMATLDTAADLDWSAVEPSIFGTLFERGLDPAKRSQIGAHYTSRADIETLVEPVLMAPLRREWEAVKGSGDNAARLALLDRLATIRVLDPACGSGNFLYVSLNLLKDLEKAIIVDAAFADYPEPTPRVHPRQLYGIEISAYAHELASVVVWIGYIQWHRNNGYRYEQKPILQKLDTIVCMDAILGTSPPGPLSTGGEGEGDARGASGGGEVVARDAVYKPEWPDVDVIVGNPPFLGGNKIRQALGDEYVDALFETYDMLPNFSDLCCYWFERAREHIAGGRAKRAGLLATQAIRGGANRTVLERIKQSGDIFWAHADREWTLDGAAVRVSMVGFDDGTDSVRVLDGTHVNYINSDLTSQADLTKAQILRENADLSFQGPSPKGPFDIPPDIAKGMLTAPLNVNGRPNSDVVKPVINAADIAGRPREYYTIDFGPNMPLEEAAQYELPFEYVKQHVKPFREGNRRRAYKERWWQYAEARVGMRRALEGLARFIVTPRVSKHRVFIWLRGKTLANDASIVFAREDDYFFGVLHSRAHEVWSLRMGTHLGAIPRYTPTTTFETFPFPWPPGEEPLTSPPGPLSTSGEGEGDAHGASEGGEVEGRDIPSRPSTLGEGDARGASAGGEVPEGWYTPPHLWKKLKPMARQKRREPTPAEDMLWQALRDRQVDGLKFRRQHPVGQFIVDFYCAERGLIVEVDGPTHDYTPEEDAIRQQFIEAQGLAVMRVTNDDARNHLPDVLVRIAGAAHQLAIAEAARELNAKREAWLNPPNAEVATLKRRTLTNLYNAMPEWLRLAHEKLDRAVFAAYGWEYPQEEEEILRLLLALNLERSQEE